MRSYRIEVSAADNGFIITANSDLAGSGKRLVATDESAVKNAIFGLVEKMFDPPPQRNPRQTAPTPNA